MSNLLKRVYTVNKDERVIDYNDLIKKKLEAIMESKHAAVDTDGFVSGLNADVVEELISDDSSEELIQDSGADSDQSAAALENANAEAARIIEDARLQAEQIVSEANRNADTAFEEAKQNGYMKAVLRQMRKLKRSSRSLRRSTIRKNQNLKMNITS